MTLIGWRRADHRLALSGHGIAGLTPRTARRADALPLGVTTRAGRTDEALHATDGAAEARIVREHCPGWPGPCSQQPQSLGTDARPSHSPTQRPSTPSPRPRRCTVQARQPPGRRPRRSRRTRRPRRTVPGRHACPVATPPAQQQTPARPAKQPPAAGLACCPADSPGASQQPLRTGRRGEQVGRHCPFWHEVLDPGQFTHGAPPVPQACSVFPGWQFPFLSQHPVGQVAGEQVGCPWHLPLALQVWPGGQLPQVPAIAAAVVTALAPLAVRGTAQPPGRRCVALIGRRLATALPRAAPGRRRRAGLRRCPSAGTW